MQIQQLSLMALYFLYGLSFYSMGMSIAFQYRSFSNFRLASSLRLLAVFGVIHGLAAWGSVFIPIMASNFDISLAWDAVILQRYLQAFSLFFLFLFGIKLVFDTKIRSYWLFALPIIALGSCLIQLTFFIPLLGTTELPHWLLVSESLIRLLMALPAGVFTAYGLALQIEEAKKIKNEKVIRDLWVATASFALFALFSGISLSQENSWINKLINLQTFHQYIGLPIEVFRTISAILATVSITKALTIFDLETQRQIDENRRWEAVYWERERFARDLHDDVIQSIYGVGIELQTTVSLITKDQESAVTKVKSIVKRLNEVIKGLRSYIQGLEVPENEQGLEELLVETIEQIREQTGLETELNFELDWDTIKQQINGVGSWQRQIKQILREALTNVVQHAKASKAEMDIRLDGNSIVLIVKDNGRGISDNSESHDEQARKHMGLNNMRIRTRLLGGSMELYSQKGKGTKLEIIIPISQEIKS